MERTTDLTTGDVHPPPAAPLPPRRPNPDHPPYAEMVRVALQFLAEGGGSTEPAISDYIVSTYPGIPPGHHNLLPYYLGKLVAARELLFRPTGRYLLPQNPRPADAASLHPPDPVRRSKRERWRTGTGRVHIPIVASNPHSDVLSGEEQTARRRLILHLRREKATHGSGKGDVAAIGWCCLGDGSRSDGDSSLPVETVPDGDFASEEARRELLPASSNPNNELVLQLENERQLSVPPPPAAVLEPDEEAPSPATRPMPSIVLSLPALPMPMRSNSIVLSLPALVNGQSKKSSRTSSSSPQQLALVAPMHQETDEVNNLLSMGTCGKSSSLPALLLATSDHETGELEEVPSTEEPSAEKPVEGPLLPAQVQLEPAFQELALTMTEKELSSVKRKRQTRKSKRLWYEH